MNRSTLVILFASILLVKQRERGQHPEIVAHPTFSDKYIPEWCLREMQVMFDAVNLARAQVSKACITMQAVASAEQAAASHSDYTAKFTESCVDMALAP